MTARWVNWAGDQVCAPAAIERPGSEAELVDVVAAAARNGARVRAVGTGHSFTDCACTDGVLVDMTGLQRIVDVDPTNGLATVEGGAELHALLAQLADRGFGLENQGDIDKQSITGATATATHGTGARFRNVSAQIVAARLVTAQGRVLEISESSDSDAYLAARVSLGALGVISQVTVKVVPLFTLHRRDELRPLDKTLHHLDEYVDGNDHFEFFVFPYGDTALTRSTRRSHEQPRPQPRWKKRLGEELENAGLDAVCRAGRRFPGAAPQLNRLLTNLLSPSTVQDHGWKVYASARKVKFTEMEYAIPREHAAAAVPRVIELVRRRKLPIMFPLEVRFSAPDEAYLSTAYGRDTCYIAVHQFTGMEFESYFRAVEEIMDEYAGRPHWGKRHYQSAATLRSRYPQWDRFAAVRDRLDPDRVFLNDYTRRVLGP
ncbi:MULTISPECIES: D-arabinono-1,4-lactone oxidase [Mycobacterium]|uniref:L-gulono-1,4-lactone dehydrogenase n=1 Tax=Mycobacterium kiyosense TaxID=2871094 RepID=A0A9P3UV13_9MYCO|nr:MULTISPECIES: D-arabinono-1,4-lactone oxidase [Mycobacterium]BDB42626.1 L-gulono-1,4-lactone dehydrogenase [Mycobacterium kiyosense]BDE14115.1 L-gulono-1,4-lactone dehydrogenase [Mycobacterium sp. 20KCMC460]GLB82948.1 L-gulono-1,4-lactone dehydrogenase [Mycobacterium kiyosense]GLB89211.1 L-gulono-1,4-lactone dehydrogenase [Mycobacterium kiyosense]GLB93862.1 L-gulono-1,4-lactone dehydrogenase [Mycobacterium kiyosense]